MRADVPDLSGRPPSETTDWLRAATLAERIASLEPRRSTRAACADEPGRQRLQRWCSQYPQLSDDHLAGYLAANGIGAETFLCIVSEAAGAPPGRVATEPPWVRHIQAAFASTAQEASRPIERWARESETVRFLNLVGPLIRRAQRRLRAGFRALRRQGAAGTLLDDRLEEALLENAARQLLPLLAPTLVLEMNVARIEGRLAGGTQERRFASFVERLREPAAALALLREYPVLARRITACLDNWTVFSLEFARRLVGDLEELRTCLAAGEEPGTIVGLDNSQGDPHQNGRSVLIATFSSGLRVVYKPRPLAAARHFQELLTWLNAKGAAPPLRTLKILDRGAYGWIEFVAGEGCTSVGEVRRFYERQGEFLALLYALEATDFHYENLIAAGEHPVLVDLETLLQPHIRHPGQAIGRAFRDSVLRIGLLPQRLFAGPEGDGIDLSGLSAVGGQALPYQVLHYESQGTDEMHAIRETGTSTGAGNQPTLNGAAIELLDHVDAILIGFRTMYRLLHRHRDELLSRDGPLARFAQDAVRVVLRPTLTYGLLLEAGRHPDALRDALELDMMLGSLWTATQGEGSLERIFPFEIEDLHGQDIPLFTTRPASRDLWTSTGRVVPGFFAETGMALARRRLRRLGDSDFARQVWFIKASLATTARGRDSERQRPKAARRTRRGADRASLLTAAVAIGDRLEALALEGDDDVAWIGLTLTSRENWSLVPLGTDLYDGLPGVAFFLAHLGQVTGGDRYTRLAGSALRTIRRQLARTPLRSLSIGAFEVLGGHIFLLTHLGIAWHEPELLIEARRNAASIRELVAGDRRFDITGGAAGCIMCLLALHHAAPGDDVLTTAVACGDHLLAHAEPREEGLAWAPYFPAKGPLTGLAHGASGIAWALLELFGASGESRFRDGALAAMAYENRFFSAEKGNWADLRETDSPAVQAYMVGWCHGAPGIGLARLQALKHIDGAGIRGDIEAALATTLRDGFRGDHCLCHGSLGNIEPLLLARDILGSSPWAGHVDRLTGATFRSIRDDGPCCSVPLGVESPGLMTGLAGIGYGLLRLAEPSRIPSVLTLAPPAQA